jgi:hypothetical protein
MREQPLDETCIRNAWEEPLGDMSENTFSRVLAGLADFDPPPEVCGSVPRRRVTGSG